MRNPRPQGYFITFEGIDTCGKSTQIKLLYNYLRKNNIETICIRDPGTTPISESIRTILLDDNNSTMSSWTELLLYEAARAQMVHEVIRPALAAGTIVLCDRFYDSTTAYQGYGRGLDLKLVKQANAIGSVHLDPDVTFFIDLDPHVAADRKQKLGDRADRLEAEGLAFQEKVRHGFCEIQTNDPDRVHRINGHQSIEEIQQDIRDIVRKCKIVD
ncbi:dTMP kinase [candidate division KSB1 bacterium]|nr:dTMP kinase [candidate division KSB1 bacterium]RQW01340.1 MAG: dTMP kinase [candidate division KSB1 bacterium]